MTRSKTPIVKGFVCLVQNPFLLIPPLLAQTVVAIFAHYNFSALWLLKFLASTYALSSLAVNGWRAIKGERVDFVSALLPPGFPAVFLALLVARTFYLLVVVGGLFFAILPGLLLAVALLPYPFAIVSRSQPFLAFEGGFKRWFRLLGIVMVFYFFLYPLAYLVLRGFAYTIVTPLFWLAVGCLWEEVEPELTSADRSSAPLGSEALPTPT